MLKCLSRAISASLAAAALAMAAWANAGQAPSPDFSVTLLVFNRPPYYLLDHGRPAGGFLLDIALAAFERAGIAVEVKEMPPNRILAAVKDHEAPVCSVGWLATSERETAARFSSPFYQNKPIGVVVNAQSPLPSGQPATLDDLLQKNATWGLHEGFSYGEDIDKKFRRQPASALKRFSDARHMVRLVALNRLDAVPIEPEELAWMQHEEPALAGSLRFVPLADAPSGIMRRIMCHTAVPQTVMDRLDAAIAGYRETDDYRRLVGQGTPDAPALPAAAGGHDDRRYNSPSSNRWEK